MKNIAIILFVLSLGFTTQAVRYCCSGTYDSTNNGNGNGLNNGNGNNLNNGNGNNLNNGNGNGFNNGNGNYLNNGNIGQIACTDDDARCIVSGAGTAQTNIGCGNDDSNATTCNDDYCNCPDGYQRLRDDPDSMFGEMKKIMFPIMGCIFGVSWVLLAFFGKRISSDIMLIVIGIIDAIFGIFLIFVPVTAFLGLFYIAIGALSIAVARHYWGGHTGINFYLALTTIIFLLTGGLTFVAYDFGYGLDYFQRVSFYVPFCDGDMNIYNGGGRSTRCGNYAYFVAFCVYLLFLIQPIALLFAAFKRVDHHTDTTVVVNEKHKK